MMTVSIVGGGASFRGVNHAKVPGHVIAANEAGLKLNCGVSDIVSMDRLWTENRWPQLVAVQRRTYLRTSALQNVQWEDQSFVRPFECDHTSVEMSEDEGTLNGTNSGVCAINLAYIKRPERLYLFGFDMKRDAKGRAYWHDPYPWTSPQGGTSNGKYASWAEQFERIKEQFDAIKCEVINVSPDSAITCFPRVHPKKLGMAA